MPITPTEIFAPLPDIERGTPYVLGSDPKGKNFIYCCGNGVVIRDIENPMKCDFVSHHTKKVTAAQYAPSGFYICSADITGTIKIWDTTQEEHLIKNEYRPITGPVKDIAWGPDSKRIAVCGAGNELHGAVILADGGSNLGKLTAITGRANSISFRSARPYRVVVGDDKYSTSFYEGPPFKSAKNLMDHSNFVQSVRYSPDGKYLATGGSDGKVLLYAAKESELIGQLEGENGKTHSGGVYSVSWSPDSRELLTVSADRTARIWDVETKKEVGKYTLDQHQNASLWMGDYLLSVSLNGQINYLNRKNPGEILKVLEGHSKPLAKITSVPNAHITGDTSGKMLKWNTETGEAQAFSGNGHTGKITGLTYDSSNDEIVTVAWDDKMRFTPAASSEYSSDAFVSLGSQPLGLANAGKGFFAVLCHKSVVLVKDKKVVFDLPHPDDRFTPSYIAASGNDVAIDGDKNAVEIYHIEGETLVKSDLSFDVDGGAVALSYSPDGSILAVGRGNKAIDIRIVADGYKNQRSMTGHFDKPTVMAWSPDSQYLASTGMDYMLKVWNIAGKKNQAFKRAHGNSFIIDMTWNSDNSMLTVGSDLLTRQWSVTF